MCLLYLANTGTVASMILPAGDHATQDGRPAGPRGHLGAGHETADLPERIVVRPVQPDDDERLVRLHGRLSPETIYKRFHSPMPTPSPALIQHLANVDGDDRQALVVTLDDEIIAVARWDCYDEDPTTAEIAILVEDAWQGHGIGRLLLTELAAAATGVGVDRFDAMVLSDNRTPMAALFRSALGEVHAGFEDGEIHLIAELAHDDDAADATSPTAARPPDRLTA